jgi:S-adenosylmethionine hydrolase
MSVITLTTDFGTRDYYVATMKGVIYSINPAARIVDITHEIEKQAVTEAGIVLKSTIRYFPTRSIHVAVVDPGVGGARRPILVESGGHWFIGPDNGIFTFACGPDARAWELTDPSVRLQSVSDTFHGRDVFSPAAAHLSLGRAADRFGPPVQELTKVPTRAPLTFHDRVLGEVIHVDSFGNLITNISREIIEELVTAGDITVELSGRLVTGLARTYTDADPGSLIALIGSTNLLEIAVRDGNAHRKLGMGRGDPVVMVRDAL